MPHRLASLLLSVLAVALFVGCETNRNQPAGPGFEAAEPVAIIDQMHGNDPALDQPARVVRLIQDRPGLDRLEADSLAELDVNFSDHDVILVTLGEQPSGGYWAHVTGVQKVGNVLYVEGMVNRPGEDEAATQALTQPYTVVIVPKTGASHALSDLDEVTGETMPE